MSALPGHATSSAVAELLDAATPGRVLVFGSPPPHGRDLDLLVRPAEEAALVAALERAGFVRSGPEWARFRGCAVEAVELVPAASWRLPQPELDALFAQATPLPGYELIVEPAPHHQLLILARLGFEPKRLARLERAASTPGAWEEARAHAGSWRADDALAALAQRQPRRPRRVPRPRRGLTVSLSGLDGAGKSFQARALGSILEQLGHEAVVVWSPLSSPLTDRVGKPVKAVLRLLRFGRFRGLAERSAAGSVMSGSAGGTAAVVWATFVAVAGGLEQRRAAARHALRGRVLIYDRHALDAVVRLRVLYGDAAATRVTRSLLRLVWPHTPLAYFLDISAQASVARKEDIWSVEQLERHRALYLDELARHPVRRIDGEAAAEDVCAEIAVEVWRALR